MGITSPAEEHFERGLWLYDGSLWRKAPLLFGFTSRLCVDLGETKDGDGTYTGLSGTVPAGEIWILQVASLTNEGGARGAASIFLRGGAERCRVAHVLTPALNQPTVFSGSVVLAEDDFVHLEQLSCISGDVIRAGVWGYKMSLT